MNYQLMAFDGILKQKVQDSGDISIEYRFETSDFLFPRNVFYAFIVFVQ